MEMERWDWNKQDAVDRFKSLKARGYLRAAAGVWCDVLDDYVSGLGPVCSAIEKEMPSGERFNGAIASSEEEEFMVQRIKELKNEAQESETSLLILAFIGDACARMLRSAADLQVVGKAVIAALDDPEFELLKEHMTGCEIQKVRLGGLRF